MKGKNRIIEILSLLYRKTDSEHFENTYSILEHLQDMGITIDRKTLQNDMDQLCDLGIGIKKIKSSPNKYYWEDRLFKEAELQILTDAVLSAGFISNSMSRALVKKLTCLTSDYRSEMLNDQIKYVSRSKTTNREIYTTISKIASAIKNKERVSFGYIKYDQYKNKVFKNGGKRYVVSPYKLYWSDDYYYLIGHCEKHKDVSCFRVDRIENIRTLSGKYVNKPEGFSPKDYADKYFKMYGGPEAEVLLEVRNDLMKYIIDKFGMAVETMPLTEETFLAKPVVKLSPVFYSWVFQFSGGIKILGPEDVVSQYEEMKSK